VKLESLNAIQGLLSIMKLQNELIENANKKLKKIGDYQSPKRQLAPSLK